MPMPCCPESQRHWQRSSRAVLGGQCSSQKSMVNLRVLLLLPVPLKRKGSLPILTVGKNARKSPMPEGDTIYRTARTLSLALAGKRVVQSSIPGLAGLEVVNVESRGKNLLIHFSGGAVLHTHMRMNGTWHIYRPGERWRKSPRAARVVLEVADFVAVCFHAPVVRLLEQGALKSDDSLTRLGPDLVQSAEVPLEEIRARLRREPDLEVGVALMRQSSLAGIGNVYKSETLFLEQISPFQRLADLSDSVLDRLILRAASLLRQNLTGGMRQTRNTLNRRERVWVYHRTGKPCYLCGSRISMRRQGEDRRSTYYCPSCQECPETTSTFSGTGP